MAIRLQAHPIDENRFRAALPIATSLTPPRIFSAGAKSSTAMFISPNPHIPLRRHGLTLDAKIPGQKAGNCWRVPGTSLTTKVEALHEAAAADQVRQQVLPGG